MKWNVPTCQIDSVGSTRDVAMRLRPTVRCCKQARMQCEHISDGPTSKRKGDTAKSKCDKPFHVLGIYSFATCCKAPGLSCAVYHDSPQIRNRLMKKTCPRGSILTGCSGYQDVHGTPTCYVEGKDKTTLVYYICCRSLKVY